MRVHEGTCEKKKLKKPFKICFKWCKVQALTPLFSEQHLHFHVDYFSEIPKTETNFEERLILKAFLLKFMNAYAPIFYVAFFKGRWELHPRLCVFISTLPHSENNYPLLID